MDTKLWSSTLTEDEQEVRRFKRFGVNLDVSPKKAKCFLEMRFVCVSHEMSEEMSTPIYFAKDTDSSMQL